MWRNLWHQLTGGRPMRKVPHVEGFIDLVNRQPVMLYRDPFGRCWWAHSSWSIFWVRSHFYESQEQEGQC